MSNPDVTASPCAIIEGDLCSAATGAVLPRRIHTGKNGEWPARDVCRLNIGPRPPVSPATSEGERIWTD